MTLYLDLLRHGETEIGGFRGSLDDSLTTLGWEQMRAAVRGRGDWQRIVSSPLQRCARFAEELAASRDLPISYMAELQELHFGDWEGRSAADLMETDERGLGLFWNDPYAFTPPSGEPMALFAKRVLGALQSLFNQYEGERLLLVVHGGVIRLLVAQARSLPREQLLQVAAGHGAMFALRVDAGLRLTEVR